MTLLESLCRTKCARQGIDPDEPWAISDRDGTLRKRWQEFKPEMEEFLALYDICAQHQRERSME